MDGKSTIRFIVMSIGLGIAITASMVAMEMPSLQEEKSQKVAAKKRLNTYLLSRDISDTNTQDRQQVAYYLNRLFSKEVWRGEGEEVINMNDKVPGENYRFSQLVSNVANRYRLVKMHGMYIADPITKDSVPRRK